MKKKGEQTAVVLFGERLRALFRRHQNEKRLPKQSRYALEGGRIVRVDDHTERLPREYVPLARVKFRVSDNCASTKIKE